MLNCPKLDTVKNSCSSVYFIKGKVLILFITKTLLYTGVRVSELVKIKLSDLDFERCQIRVNAGKGNKDRIVPFPVAFKEVLVMHVEQMRPYESDVLV